ncbi:MAG: nucleoside-diphosphate kinase [Planctomycetota bacterium]
MESTLIIIKPDAVQRHLIGRVLSRFEEKGLILTGMKLIHINLALAEKHYAEHVGKHFYNRLINFITSGPVVVLALSGVDVIQVCRNMVGSTCGRDAAPGTIRGDFGMSDAHNLIHASDSPASAEREIRRFFREEELIEGIQPDFGAVYDLSCPEPR